MPQCVFATVAFLHELEKWRMNKKYDKKRHVLNRPLILINSLFLSYRSSQSHASLAPPQNETK